MMDMAKKCGEAARAGAEKWRGVRPLNGDLAT